MDKLMASGGSMPIDQLFKNKEEGHLDAVGINQKKIRIMEWKKLKKQKEVEDVEQDKRIKFIESF